MSNEMWNKDIQMWENYITCSRNLADRSWSPQSEKIMRKLERVKEILTQAYNHVFNVEKQQSLEKNSITWEGLPTMEERSHSW